MGVNSSKATSTIETTTKIMTNVLVKMSQNCSASTVQTQKIELGNVGEDLNLDGISQEASAVVDFSCIQGSDSQNNFANEVSQQLTTELNAKLSGLSIGLSNNASTDSAVKSVVEAATNVQIDDIKICMALATQDQAIKIGNVGKNATLKNIKQSEVISLVAKCTQQSKSLVAASNKLDSIVKTKADSSIAGLSLPDFLGLAGAGLICLIILIIICCVISSGGSDGGSGGRS